MMARWKVTTEEKVEGIALGDSGADLSAIPRSMIEDLRNKDIILQTTALSQPIWLSMAVKTSYNTAEKPTAMSYCHLSLTYPVDHHVFVAWNGRSPIGKAASEMPWFWSRVSSTQQSIASLLTMVCDMIASKTTLSPCQRLLERPWASIRSPK